MHPKSLRSVSYLEIRELPPTLSSDRIRLSYIRDQADMPATKPTSSRMAERSPAGKGFQYALDIPPRLLVLQEIQQITSSMRRSPRWASPSSTSSAAYYSATHRRPSSASGPTEMVERSLGTSSASGPSSLNSNVARRAQEVSPSSNQSNDSGPSLYGKRLAQGEGEEMELLAAFVGLRRSLSVALGELPGCSAESHIG